MSFHPNDIVKRGRVASLIVAGVLLFLVGGFFRSQVLHHQKYALNRARTGCGSCRCRRRAA